MVQKTVLPFLKINSERVFVEFNVQVSLFFLAVSHEVSGTPINVLRLDNSYACHLLLINIKRQYCPNS